MLVHVCIPSICVMLSNCIVQQIHNLALFIPCIEIGRIGVTSSNPSMPCLFGLRNRSYVTASYSP